MNILITGAAGFIGFHLVQRMAAAGHRIVGLDNLNAYYDVSLKLARLQASGIDPEELVSSGRTAISEQGTLPKPLQSTQWPAYRFFKMDITDSAPMNALFHQEQFDLVLHMAAQAGVRYSLENPDAYVQSNLVGFMQILECCRHHGRPRLLYASSSSVYGMSAEVPFRESAQVDRPVSLYAATKKSNELLAHSYSHLYDMETIGLRFFTVYGPWGRPDMAMFLFTDAIMNERPLRLYNHGAMWRDFTYIDDIVSGIEQIIVSSSIGHPNADEVGAEPVHVKPNYQIYNLGNSQPVPLSEFITAIESATGKKALIDHQEMQPGDVERTWADVTLLQKNFQYRPSTPVVEGVRGFVDWYRQEYETRDQGL